MTTYSIVEVYSSQIISPDNGYEVYLADASDNDITLTMSAINTDGSSYIIKRIDNSSNHVYVNAHTNDTIEGGNMDLTPGKVVELISFYNDLKWFNLKNV